MFQKLSASKLPVAAACPASMAMEAHGLPSSKWAERGTTIHEFIDRAFRGSRDVALAAIEDEDLAIFCSRIPLHEIEEHIGGKPRTEVQFAYDPVDDITHEYGIGEKFAANLLGGKVDGHLKIGRNLVRGADWKTGFVRVPAPLQNLQLRAYALMLSRRYEVDRVEFAVVDIDEDGFPFVRNAVFEEMELDAARTEIREIMDSVAAERDRKTVSFTTGSKSPRLQVGAHCRYCEALPSCPAFVGVTQALVPLADRTLTMTPAQIGEQWAAAGAVQIALDRFESAVRFQVERGLVVPLPDGKVLRAIEVQNRTVSGKVTLDVLREMGMEPAFLTASKVTFAGIERACGDGAPAVLKRIEELGGITSKTHVQMRALKPKKEP